MTREQAGRVALLTAAALVAGVIATAQSAPGAVYPFVRTIQGVFLGLVLAAYLRIAGDVETLWPLAAIVLVSGAAFWIAVFAPFFLGPMILAGLAMVIDADAADLSWTVVLFVAGAVGAAIVSATFLALVRRTRVPGRFGRDIAWCTIAGGALALIGESMGPTRRGGMSEPRVLQTIVIVWYGGLALLLGILAERRRLNVRPFEPGTREPVEPGRSTH